MDPLSLTASILTLIAAGNSVLKRLRKAEQIWRAPQEIQDLTIEIQSLQSTLNNTKTFVETSQSSIFSQSLTEPVNRASSTIKGILSFVEIVSTPKSHLSGKNQARFIWLKHQKDVKLSVEKLKVIKTDLSLQLSLVAASSATKSLSISIGIEEKLSQNVSITIDQDSGRDDHPSGPLVRTNSAEDNDISVSTPQRIPGDSSPALEAILTGDDGHQSVQRSRAFDTPLGKPSEQCDIWCSCTCHTRRTFKCPWILETVIGRFNVRYTGQRPECNETRCKRTSTVPITMTYLLPKYLCNRYMTMTMRYNPLDGPACALRAPRVTAWTHLYWKYANSGDVVAIQKMFAQGKASPSDYNLIGCNALMYEAVLKSVSVIQFLMSQGADPYIQCVTGRAPKDKIADNAFSGEYGKESVSIVRGLLKDVNCFEGRGLSRLHKIVLRLLVRDLKTELEVSTAEINIGDSRERTPLFWAVVRDDIEAVKLLLEFKANPNIADEGRDTPLHFVKSIDVCKLLLNAGANVHARNDDHERTALHHACIYHEAVDVVECLVEAGKDVDVRSNDDETPLLNAIFHGNTKIAKGLIELGANVNAANISSRHNTIHMAIASRHHEIIPILLVHGVDYLALDARHRTMGHVAADSADTQTLNILAESRLKGLDLSVDDEDGKTAADQIVRREIFSESEEGIYEAFEAFAKSVEMHGQGYGKREDDSKIDPQLLQD